MKTTDESIKKGSPRYKIAKISFRGKSGDCCWLGTVLVFNGNRSAFRLAAPSQPCGITSTSSRSLLSPLLSSSASFLSSPISHSHSDLHSFSSWLLAAVLSFLVDFQSHFTLYPPPLATRVLNDFDFLISAAPAHTWFVDWLAISR